MTLKCKNQYAGKRRSGISAYISAIVLGLNDALVELTGALAGFTMALPNNRLIILAGVTTGVAATLSMAAAEFLSQKNASEHLLPWKASLYTGVAYLITVALLLIPFFIFSKPLVALSVCLAIGAFIIMIFTWVVARIRKSNFPHDFLQMLVISFSVAAIAFCISWGAKRLWGIDI